ncbi:peptidase S41 [Saccharibacter sp. 17.LH.SD]|uniref:S41 family peptidase n=1 Tax=Saccharibacter sp. 17.LH.SD TaxID=2689393 RepID=UPI001368CA92|nr:S41 family peptidase [Saccharibacter sp. 17.LH.SD]MXV43834.1 peptidase S41 [Saccharibacter sp. 17.LH.SD]
MLVSSLRSFRLHLKTPQLVKSTLLALVLVVGLSAAPTYAAASMSKLPEGLAPTTPKPPPSPGHKTPLNTAVTRNVLASGLSFILPRLLNEHSPEELSLWGLGGVIETDPSLHLIYGNSPSAPLSIKTVTLQQGKSVLLTRPIPTGNDLSHWVDFILMFIQVSWNDSDTLQTEGSNQLLSHFFAGLFRHLDPYSRYLSPDDVAAEKHTQRDDTCAVGITLKRHTEVSYPSVSDINTSGSAWAQGVSVGQTILAINGHNTRHIPLHVLQHWLSGPPGSKIVLTIRTAKGRVRTLAVSRMRLPQETVSLSHQGPYAVLHIAHFTQQTAEEISQYLSSMLPDSPQEGDSTPSSTGKLPGLILDLRGNHGGLLQQAVVTAALFLDHGVAVTTEGRYPSANHIWTVQGGDLTNNTPIIVLVDEDTASSAEVLAAALADHHRAVIVGSYTFGKGFVQIAGKMPNQGEIVVTWARNIAPQGWPIQGIGVAPQLCTATSHPSVKAQLSALREGKSLEHSLLVETRANHPPLSKNTIMELRNHCPPLAGGKTDMEAAVQLLRSPAAYRAALNSVPESLSPAE